MQNHFPLWKILLILVVSIVGIFYAIPNLYGDDPSVLFSPVKEKELTQAQVKQVEELLATSKINSKAVEIEENKALIRFENTDQQLLAADHIRDKMGDDFTVALNLAPATPEWLQSFGADPMYLGLDLRGGVHFLMEVDMVAAIKQAEERYVNDIRSVLRVEKIRYKNVAKDQDRIRIKLKSEEDAGKAANTINNEFRSLDLKVADDTTELFVTISEAEQKEIKKFALEQNITCSLCFLKTLPNKRSLSP